MDGTVRPYIVTLQLLAVLWHWVSQLDSKYIVSSLKEAVICLVIHILQHTFSILRIKKIRYLSDQISYNLLA